MGTTPVAKPALVWSLARQGTFDRCRRRYFLRYYAGWGGWSSKAPPPVRLAYALGKLTSLPLTLGIALHDAARLLAIETAGRRPLPTVDQLRGRIRAELNRVVRSSRNVEAFLGQPRLHPMLHEIYYGGQLSPGSVARTVERMELCTEALLHTRLWSDLRVLPPGSILSIDSLEVHEVNGLPLYAAPDLAYLSSPGTVTLVDYKSGRTKEGDALGQLALYATVIRRRLGPSAPTAWRGRVILLDQDEEITFDLTDAELDRAWSHASEGFGAMTAMLQDPDSNTPLPVEAFAMTSRRAHCPACPFWEICGEEIQAGSYARRDRESRPSSQTQVSENSGR